MSVDHVLFIILGVLAVASALMVITRKSPITAAMFLVMHFMSLGGLYLTLHAQFMAVIQVLDAVTVDDAAEALAVVHDDAQASLVSGAQAELPDSAGTVRVIGLPS